MNRANCAIVIPSRWGSKRLPGKPLLEISGKPIISLVIERALKSKYASKVIVATDHNEIKKIAKDAGAEAIMTRGDHINGTERVIEVAELYDYDYYINVQGDEPFVSPKDIDKLINSLKKDRDIVSLCSIEKKEDIESSNNVKVVFDEDYNAIYFSRNTIPYGTDYVYKHMGVYGFRKEVLKKIKKLTKTNLEDYESLEQLRWINNGIKIKMEITKNNTIGIDTKDDLETAREIFFMNNLQAIVSDVDGVLTDGRLSYGPNGEEVKLFHCHDGLAIKSLINQGIKIGWISSRNSKALRFRAKELGISNTLFGIKDKRSGSKKLITDMNINPKYSIYIGDDSNDIEASKYFGKIFAVSNSTEEFKRCATNLLKTSGGCGVFREIQQKINKISEKFNNDL